MKKVIAAILTFVMMFGLCACTNNSEEEASRQASIEAEEQRLKDLEEAADALDDIVNSRDEVEDLIDEYKNAR